MFAGKAIRAIRNTDWNETVIELMDGTLLSINTEYLEGEYETSYFIYDESAARWNEVQKDNLN